MDMDVVYTLYVEIVKKYKIYTTCTCKCYTLLKLYEEIKCHSNPYLELMVILL